jgi:hypothetical protein
MIDSTKRTARRAGLLYLLLAVSAPLDLLVVPAQLIVKGNATATADRVRASEWLLRLGIGSELFHQAVVIFLVLVLYRLFKPISEYLASLVVILGALVSVPIVFVNVLNEIAALILVSGAEFLAVYDKGQLDALAYLFLRLHGQGIVVASVFWGLWLFPFGVLVARSGFIPRVFGVLLIVAGVGYLSSAFATLITPRYAPLVGQVAGILEIAEVPIIFWLLIWGARDRPSTADASVRAAPPSTS